MSKFQIEHGLSIPPIVEDLTGRRFGRLLVIERAESSMKPNGSSNARWLCRCDCGREKIVLAGSLRGDVTNSCVCLCGEKAAERQRAKVPNVVGQRFGRLLVLSQNGTWCQVRCDCKTEKTVPSYDLRSGKTDSCGCLNLERLAERQRAKVMQHRHNGGNDG
jgi:hypothetical protein